LINPAQFEGAPLRIASERTELAVMAAQNTAIYCHFFCATNCRRFVTPFVMLSRSAFGQGKSSHESKFRTAICELVDGTLVEKPMGWEESAIAGLIIHFLVGFAKPRRLGTVFRGHRA
jgi:hypothetical protein